jgi:hypothetical protein
MKTWIGRTLKGGLVALSAITFLISCQDDLTPGRLSSKEQANLAAEDNAQMMMATQEMLDITAGAMKDKGVAEGRTKHGDHDNYGCKPIISLTLNIDRNRADTIIYSGSISVNYGNGSSCDVKNKRTGKITDVFNIIVSTKNKVQFKSTETLTFEGFLRDSLEYNGTIIVGSANLKKTTVEGQNVTIEYTDGTSSLWNGSLTFAYEDVSKKKGEIRVGGKITGTSRQALPFTAVIKEEVIYKPGCFGWIKKIPVDGIVTVTTNGETSTLDYGKGTCDKTYTLTVDGETTTHTFTHQ